MIPRPLPSTVTAVRRASRLGRALGSLVAALLVALGPGSSAAAVLKGVQSGSATLSPGSATTTATLSPSVDTSKSFLVMTVRTSGNLPDDDTVTGEITNGTTLTFQRVSSGTTINIEWYVAEFTSGVTVQRGSQPVATTSFNVGISSVNLARAFPIVSYRSNTGTRYDDEDFVRVRLTSATNLNLTFGATPGAGSQVAWQVVEYDNASVQSGNLTLNDGQGSATASPTSVNVAKSWLVYSYTVGAANPTPGSEILARGRITGPTTLSFDRDGTNGSIDLTWYLVEFQDGTDVQQGSANFSTGATQQNIAISAVDLSHTIAAGGYLQYGGKSNVSSNDVSTGWATADLTSTTNLRLTRSVTGSSTADLPWWVVEFGVQIAGRVFEDVNYGGGAGRTQAASSGVARSGARVELYDGSGNFSTFTITDASGDYAFGGLAAGNYTVRVVNSTVTSSRTGFVVGLLPVQTFRTTASTGAAAAVTDHVGGEVPGKADAGNGSTTLAALTTATLTAQSITTVTITPGDVTAVDFGFNFDTVVNTAGTGQGSLRQFITNANALANAGLAQAGRTAAIEHAIWMLADGTARPGTHVGYATMFSGGVATVSPASALPAVNAPAVIDAQTQAGWAAAPIVRVDGVAAGAGVDGFSFTTASDASILRGLIVTRLSRDGVLIQAGADGLRVSGCWIGTSGTGSTGTGNADDGIDLRGASAVIGGTTYVERNVINNSGDEGIDITGASATGNTVTGNFIGLDPDGATGSGNTDVGIAIIAGATGNTIGGTTAGARNVLSMNLEGIEISTTGNTVQGNYVGTDSTGTLDRGQRSSDGVQIIAGGNNNLIGGTAAGAGNLIAFTKAGRHGVSVQAGTGNGVLGNRIRANTGLGIELGNDGVTANNGTKNGALANSGMDSPVFTSATLTGANLTVMGYVGSAAGQSLFAAARVEIFQSDSDPSGYGEGPTYLGFLTSDANGNFSGSLVTAALTLGDRISGTATDASNNTSEFGAQRVVDGLTIVKRAFRLDGTPIPNGTVVAKGSLFKFLLYVSNPGPAVTDVSLRDILDPGFAYLGGTLRVDNLQSACAGGCSGAQESAVFAAANAGSAGTDVLDGDTVSRAGATLFLGDQDVANARLDIAANRVYAVVFTVKMR